jgi:hypothetical protein
MNELLDVCQVQPLTDFTLILQFENGEWRTFDMKPLLEIRPFDRLKDQRLFFRATIDYGTVVWPDNIDIAPETLYVGSTPGAATVHC